MRIQIITVYLETRTVNCHVPKSDRKCLVTSEISGHGREGKQSFKSRDIYLLFDQKLVSDASHAATDGKRLTKRHQKKNC